MSLIEIKGLKLSFTEREIFNNTNLMVQKGDRIGLVGPNGCGKTTFLKILLGEIVQDDGIIRFNGKLKIGYLDQYADIKKDITIYEYLNEAFKELYALDDKINEIYESLVNYNEDEQLRLIAKAQNHTDYLIEQDFSQCEKRITNVLQGLGFNEEDKGKKISILSGGQKTKIILGKLLLQPNDLLILDESTNFLDINYISWLGEFLSRYKGTFIIISHDKAFLNKISTKTVEIANRKFNIYNGNYDFYAREKVIREEKQLEQHIVQEKYIQKSQEYIDKFIGQPIINSKATWLKKMLERLERIEVPDEIIKPEFKFKYAGGLPKLVITLKNTEIGYKEPILPPISIKIEKGEKYVIKGFNGIGKTTLLKTISLELPAISGDIEYGDGIKSVFLKQEEDYENNFSSFDKNQKMLLGIKKGKQREITVIEFITEYFPEKPNKELQAAVFSCGLHDKMLFSKVRTLSGGEMTKLRLCIAMLRPVNFIILDEPTNHLDVYSKDVLLHALNEFEGNVLLTTHDVNFDTSWATKTFNLEELFN